MLRRLAVLLPLVAMGGCATLDDFFAGIKKDRDAVALEDRPVQEPIAPNDFLLTYTDQTVIGEPQVVFTRKEDTLSDLAREYGLGYDEIITANPGIDPWLPGENTPVVLPTQYVLPDVPKVGVVLNIATKRLFYFPEAVDGEQQQVLTYPIGIGRVGWETPLGATKVISKARDPHWWVPASVRREHAEMGNPLPA
ncbi:MAG: L,D-transpeptidase family protein, partial [Woeseiaceae bacterium]